MKNHFDYLLQRFNEYWQDGREEKFSAAELRTLEQYFLENAETRKLSRLIQLGIRLYPDDPYFMVRHAHLLLESGQTEAARKVLSYMELEYPDDVDVHLLRLHIFLFDGEEDYAEMGRRLQGIIDRFRPLDTGLASMLFRLVKWVYDDRFPTKTWLDKIFAATRRKPEDIREYLHSLDDVSLLDQDAEDLFPEAVAAFPNDTELLLLYAGYLIKWNKDREDIKELLRIILIRDPDNVTAHLYLAELMEAEGDYDMAIIHYNKIQSVNDPSASIYLRIGVCHEKSGRSSEAQDFYRLAVNEDPAFLPAWHALIQSHMQEGQLDKAISCNLDAVDNIPNRKLFETLGYLYLQKKYFPSALKAYEEAFQLGSRDKNILLVLHDLYDQNGDFHKAEEIIRYARWQYPEDPDIRQRLQKYDLW